jgi:hypothetical protein
VTTLAAAVVLWPAVSGQPDSFPHSTYPMFAARRDRVELGNIRGIQPDGTSVALSPALLGTGEVMHARALVAAAVRGGKKQSLRLCRRVAERVSQHPEFATLRALEVSLDRYDSVRYFTESRIPVKSRTLAQCDVPQAESGR